jgi:hypothetical protein
MQSQKQKRKNETNKLGTVKMAEFRKESKKKEISKDKCIQEFDEAVLKYYYSFEWSDYHDDASYDHYENGIKKLRKQLRKCFKKNNITF